MKKLLLFSFLILLKAAAVLAQAPAITYVTPQVYPANKPITNLLPKNTGGAVPANTYSNVTTFAGSSAGFANATGTAAKFNLPIGITTDSQGNVYVADEKNNQVRKITPAGAVTTFATVANPFGIASDGNDNIFVSDGDNNVIYKITPDAVVSVYAGTGTYSSVNGPAELASFRSPYGLATDAAGNVYVSELGGNAIRLIKTNGQVSTLATGFNLPYGLVVDAAGNVYVADSGNNQIKKITPAGVVSVFAGSGVAGKADGTGTSATLAGPTAVTIDVTGNIYVADSNNNLIRQITPAGVVTTFAGSGEFQSTSGVGTAAGFFFPNGITGDAYGHLYVTDRGTSTVRKVDLTGYTISPALIGNLSFNVTNGTINGIPLAGGAATTYTITAYNAKGKSATTLDIRLAATDATLKSLLISTGTLDPVFSPTSTSYTVFVPNSTSTISVTPTLNEANATLKINGTVKKSGLSSGLIPLNAGTNNIVISVIAEDGQTAITYNVNVQRTAPPVDPPAISYTTPNTFVVGKAIPNLAPSNSGGVVPAKAFANVTTFATGLNHPTGVATDAQGNVYVTNYDLNNILKITPGGTVSVFSAAVNGYSKPWSLGTDPQGNVYVADSQNNIIRKISGGVVSTYAGNGDNGYLDGPRLDAKFRNPTGVTSDVYGNLYVADSDNNLIRKISVNGEVTTYAGTTAIGSLDGPGTSATFSKPFNVASDASGNIYVADKNNNKIRKIAKDGTVTTLAGSGAKAYAPGNGTAAAFDTPQGLTTDALGNVYVADSYNSMIRKITPAGEVSLLAGIGTYGAKDGIGEDATFQVPTGVANDEMGHLYVADYVNNSIRKIDIVGYQINPVLPAGLNFDATTGIISGTPTTATPMKIYSVTAYNLGGSNTFRVRIAVVAPSPDATLKDLTISTGALIEPFVPANPNYTSTSSATATSIKLTPTVNTAGATITVNGVTAVSGVATAALPLTIGANVFTIKVTASDGVSTKTYKVTVTRPAPPPSGNANLSSLTPSAGSLNETFNQATITYTMAVAKSVSKIKFTPVTADAGATVTVNGTAAYTGFPSDDISLSIGPNPVKIVVSPSNGGAPKTYTVTVTRAGSANANLSNLTLSAGTLAPDFDAATTDYIASVSNAVANIKLTPTVSDPNSTITVNGTAVASGTASGNIILFNGDNVITVAVTAEDGVTKKTYNVTVSRPASSDATLSALVLSSGTLSPSFLKATTNYTATVNNTITGITIKPTATFAGSAITVNGTAVASGTASGNIPLVVGDNIISTVITAEDGLTKSTYTVTVKRLPAANANLTDLSLSAGTLTPAFATATISYTASVPFTVTSIRLKPTLSDAGATIKINGLDADNATESPNIHLNLGANTITTVVTAQDGATTKTYTVTVTRLKSTDADLSALTPSEGTLSPAFAATTVSYNTTIDNSTTSITLTPKVHQVNATVTVNGVAVVSGSPSAPVSLNVGPNPIKVVVTAQDGVTTKTYTVTATRKPSSLATLAFITLSDGTLDPAFVSATTTYTASVNSLTTSIKVTPTADEANATIKVNGLVVASGSESLPISLNLGANVININVTAQDGITTKAYKITVTRQKSTNADLSNITLSSGTLDPVFAAATLNYKASVGNTVTTINLTPTVGDAASKVLVNGVAVASGSASGNIPLVVGDNKIKIDVTAEDGVSTKTYIVTVTRNLPANADLTGLTLSAGALDPAFSTGNQSYKVVVENAVATTTATPTLSDPLAKVTVNGTAVASGTASGNIPLVVGDNVVSVKVTAQDGSDKTYTVTVTRKKSSNADLAGLTVSTGILSPAFAANTLVYTVPVDNAVENITLTPGTSEGSATVTVNGTSVASGSTSPAIPLAVGNNDIKVVVTAQDGTTTKTYTITVNRKPSSNANLADLKVSSGTLAPSFVSGVSAYDVPVPNSVNTIKITPTVSQANATITVNGVAVASGTGSAALPLNVGDNVISTVVTAQDGVTTNTYTVTVKRAPSSNANLAKLVLSENGLSPNFSTFITAYSALVKNNVTSVTLTPTADDPNATITINDIPVASGTVSAPINLNVGNNVLKVVVTAQDGITKKTYTLTINRAQSSDDDLADLNLSTGVLDPTFQSGINNYNASVSNSTTSITVTPTVADAAATVTVNGSAVISGKPSAPINLVVGDNIINVIVVAQNGSVNPYKVVVKRIGSANADLISLILSSGPLTPAFDNSIFTYSANADKTVSGVRLRPTASDPTAKITVNGETVTSGSNSNLISLTTGLNAIEVKVTAQDGTTVKKYTVIITKEKSNNADLAGLAISEGSLSPGFSASVTNYTTNVVSDVTSIDVSPFSADANASITVNGVPVASSSIVNVDLQYGPNVITTVVTSEDGSATKTYTLTVTRLRSSDATLANLTITKGTFSPSFNSYTTDYTGTVGNAIGSLNVIPTVNEPNATVTVNGNSVGSGSSSPIISLAVGPNVITTTVTAQDGTTNTYTITITREAPVLSTDAKLVALTASSGSLNPTFSSNTTTYAVQVSNLVTSITLTPQVNYPAATVTVNGLAVVSGNASDPIDLNVGVNPVIVRVTAEDGTTTKDYVVNVIREAPPKPSDANLLSLTVSEGSLDPSFSKTRTSYKVAVDYAVTTIRLTPTLSDPLATVKVDGLQTFSGSASQLIPLAIGETDIDVVVSAQNGTTKTYTVTVIRAVSLAKMPSAITPNNDGINDTWVIPNIELYPNCTVKIFNRGGQIVFSSVGYGVPWNGTYNGKVLPADVYYYIFDTRQAAGIKSGSVTIIR